LSGNQIIEALIRAGLNAELAGAFAGGLAARAGAVFGQSFNKLTQAEQAFAVPGDAIQAVRQAFQRIGKIAAEEVDDSAGQCVLATQTRAGWLNANPALLIAVIEKQNVQAVVLAKEGLIDQKTAAGALRRFGDVLLDLGETAS